MNHAAHLARLLEPRALNAERITGAEIGTFRGETAAYLLRAFPRLVLYSVDRWSPAPYQEPRNRFHALAHNNAHDWQSIERQAHRACAFARARWHPVRLDFREAARNWPADSLDFVFLDAAHSEEDTRDQLAAWVPKVKPGGLIAGHDYGYPRPGFEGVKKAVDAYAAAHGLALTSDPISYVFHWTRPPCPAKDATP